MIKIIDTDFLIKNQQRYVDFFPESDFLHQIVVENVASRLFMNDTYKKLLLISPKPTSNFDLLTKNLQVEEIIYADFSSHYLKKIDSDRKLVISAEALPFQNNSFDLVISLLNIHQINDIQRYCTEIKRIMQPGGLFLGSLFGIGTMLGLRRCFAQAESQLSIPSSPHFLPLTDIVAITNLISKIGFKEPVADCDSIEVSYKDLSDIFKDLNYMGETNALLDREKKPISKMLLNKVRELCRDDSNPDTPFKTTFELIYISAFK